MKLLLDEQLPTKLKYRFADIGHEVFTVRDMNWLGIKNGVLLKLIAENDFQVFVTNDKNMYFQQKMEQYKFSILNLNTKTNRYEDVMAVFDRVTTKLIEIVESLDNFENARNNYFVVDKV